jgi:SAM-dependent methyltransferase
MKPYKVCGPVMEDSETLGQWLKEITVAESIELCEYETTYSLFLKYLPKDGWILESGCGTGRWVFYLWQRGFNVIGIDRARAPLEIAKAHDPSVPVLIDDVLHSQFPDKRFDAVISLGVVEHFEEGPQRALAELRRILKDDGVILISVPINNPARRLLFNPVKGAYQKLVFNPLRKLYHWSGRGRRRRMTFWEYRYTRKEFRSYLEGAGFEILETAPQDFRSPKNLGLHTDFPSLHSRRGKFELNALGKLISAVFQSLSPWAACSGVLCVCRKAAGQVESSADVDKDSETGLKMSNNVEVPMTGAAQF